MALTSISPLDGRYAAQVQSLAPYFSEEALIRYRIPKAPAFASVLARIPKSPRACHPRSSTACSTSGITCAGVARSSTARFEENKHDFR